MWLQLSSSVEKLAHLKTGLLLLWVFCTIWVFLSNRKGRGKSKCLDCIEFELWELHTGTVVDLCPSKGSGISEISHRLSVLFWELGYVVQAAPHSGPFPVGFSSGPWALSHGGNWPRLWILANNNEKYLNHVTLTVFIHSAKLEPQLRWLSHPQASVTAHDDGPGKVQPSASEIPGQFV